MRHRIGILIVAIVLIGFGCTQTWDDHYNKQPETINMNVWDAIKGKSELSSFVDLMVKYKFDTLFTGNDTYTIFAPDNTALAKMKAGEMNVRTLNYLISRHFIVAADIKGKRKLQTLEEKFSTFENVGGKSTYDDIPLNFESPLYLNGKFFILSQVPLPKLNLYEYIGANNTYLKSYIDKQDTIILDMEKSRPIGFDALGRTVYDTVSIKANLFELNYFPVSQEYRSWTATLAFPRQANYERALTEMAQKLGGIFHDYKDIPVKWQEDILIPHLVKHGSFLNMLEPEEFLSTDVLTKKKKYNMVNIQGDSILVDYKPAAKYLSSNGVGYDYTNFVVPDSLYSGSERFEGEWLAITTGANKYTWRKNVTQTSTSSFDVLNSYIKGASNDSILIVNFAKGYKGTYKLQFNVRNLFPRKYLVSIYTHMDIGGLYDIYINNVLVKTFDYYEYIKSRGIIKSVTGKSLAPTGRYNSFDFYCTNITDYGRPVIRFEYKGPGTSVPNNGLVIDKIDFTPAE